MSSGFTTAYLQFGTDRDYVFCVEASSSHDLHDDCGDSSSCCATWRLCKVLKAVADDGVGDWDWDWDCTPRRRDVWRAIVIGAETSGAPSPVPSPQSRLPVPADQRGDRTYSAAGKAYRLTLARTTTSGFWPNRGLLARRSPVTRALGSTKMQVARNLEIAYSTRGTTIGASPSQDRLRGHADDRDA
jgi:hypothetical protein